MNTPEFLSPGISKEARILLELVRSYLFQTPSIDVHDMSVSAVDWHDLHKLAVHNRLAVLLLRGLKSTLMTVPQDFRTALQHYEDATVRMNSASLLTLRRIIPILQSHGVNTVAFKGTTAQRIVYGDFFSKPALDVDLLVSPRDFAVASRLISNNGFVLAQQCSSFWWKFFLGEQHFLRSNPSLTTIDLHLRVQQPGCPAPRLPALFLAQPESVAVGGIAIPTLSRANTCLLSSISLTKALMHREPAGGHVSDIAASVLSSKPGEIKLLVDAASQQGLRNALLLGLRAARVLFGIRIGPVKAISGNVLDATSDSDLLGMILLPRSKDTVWRKRSTMLWDLCDEKTSFPGEMSWKIGADLCRRLSDAQQRVRC